MSADVAGYSDERLEQLLMRASMTSSALAAGYRLAFQAPEIRRWLIAEGLLTVTVEEGQPVYAVIDFDGAVSRLDQLRRQPHLSPLSRSDIDTLSFAASFAGAGTVNLRSETNLDAEALKRVCEALMYACGFMDGLADPTANSHAGGGPNSRAYDKLLDQFT